MSEITEWFPTETLGGDVMPWYGCVVEGSRFLILPGRILDQFGVDVIRL